jgi:hypothetical protein
MPTLWQKTTTLCVFENKGALYEHFLAMIITAYVRLAEQNGGFPDRNVVLQSGRVIDNVLASEPPSPESFIL